MEGDLDDNSKKKGVHRLSLSKIEATITKCIDEKLTFLVEHMDQVVKALDRHTARSDEMTDILGTLAKNMEVLRKEMLDEDEDYEESCR